MQRASQLTWSPRRIWRTLCSSPKCALLDGSPSFTLPQNIKKFRLLGSSCSSSLPCDRPSRSEFPTHPLAFWILLLSAEDRPGAAFLPVWFPTRHGPSQASCSPQPPAQLSPSFPLHHARCNSRSSLSELIKSIANRKKKKKSLKKSRLSRKPRGTGTSPPPRRGADFRSLFVSAKSPPGCLKLQVQNR